MIKVHPNSELGHLLAQADEKPLMVEKEGVRYAIYRADNAERPNTQAYRAGDDREVRSPVNSRLADGYQSIPALEKTKTWKEVEEIVRQERAAHYAAKGV